MEIELKDIEDHLDMIIADTNIQKIDKINIVIKFEILKALRRIGFNG